MRSVLTISIIFFLSSCVHNKQPYKPVESELKFFFDQMDDSILTKEKFLLIDSVYGKWKDLFMANATADTALTKDEISFIANQIDRTVPNTWKGSFFDSGKIVSKSYLNRFRKSYNVTPIHYRLSYPYFSKDKKYCVLYYDYYCGNLCAEESLRLYKNENGKWVLLKLYFSIMS